jgi:membrane associated rhomboid family serine protease
MGDGAAHVQGVGATSRRDQDKWTTGKYFVAVFGFIFICVIIDLIFYSTHEKCGQDGVPITNARDVVTGWLDDSQEAAWVAAAIGFILGVLLNLYVRRQVKPKDTWGPTRLAIAGLSA